VGAEGAAELQPDRYYLLGDAGSFFFDPAGDNEGFGSPEAAAEWARTQTVWPELTRDLREGVAAVVLGSEWAANHHALSNSFSDSSTRRIRKSVSTSARAA